MLWSGSETKRVISDAVNTSTGREVVFSSQALRTSLVKDVASTAKEAAYVPPAYRELCKSSLNSYFNCARSLKVS